MKPKTPKFLAVDFFCGAGGTTRGLIDAGGYVIAGIDKDPACELTYTSNNANASIDYSQARFLCKDIFRKTEDHPEGQQREIIKELKSNIEYYRAKAPHAPLFFAICAPCQPFTKVSKKALSEERKAGRAKDSNLLLESLVFVKKFKPDIILSENVPGIRQERYGCVWDEFEEQLSKLGYAVGSKVVCASKFGVPQFRKRSILLAVKKNIVRPTYFSDMLMQEILIPTQDPKSCIKSVEDAIGHFPCLGAGEAHDQIPNHRTRWLSETNIKRITLAKPGESNKYLDGTGLELDCHKRMRKKNGPGGFGDVYTRLVADKPSGTITTKCHSISNGRFGHYDTSQNRGISLREAAALQSFPDDYRFYPEDGIDPVARMIGNAVPPRLAEYFANYAIASLKTGDA
ncbi:MAG: DNA cytosine methyltransferase [Rhodospirillales bacterium]|nr:DNA cytosine methyltransferase [Rhodospirillales bacterium]